jgi:hypothetical protein
MKPDPIEPTLSQQRLRPPPARWRAEILAAAAAAAGIGCPPATDRTPGHPALPWRRVWCHDWLWPSPIAWGSLAATWIAIFALRLAAPSIRPSAAVPGVPMPTAAAIFATQREHQAMARLFEPPQTTPADRPRRPAAGPRSESIGSTLSA